MKKVFKQKKIESHTQNPIEPTNEIFFRLKRPVDKKVCDFICNLYINIVLFLPKNMYRFGKFC